MRAASRPIRRRRIDRASTACAAPTLDAVAYRLSSAADHSLLWHLCGAATACARGGDVGVGARFAAAMGAESLLTNGVVKTASSGAAARVRRHRVRYGMHRPITSSFPSGHATAAFCAATLLGGGPAGTHWPARSRPPACTSGCTTRSDIVAGAPSARPRERPTPVRAVGPRLAQFRGDAGNDVKSHSGLAARPLDFGGPVTPPVRRELRLPIGPFRSGTARGWGRGGLRAGRDWDVRFLPFSLEPSARRGGRAPRVGARSGCGARALLALCWGIAVLLRSPTTLGLHIAAFAARTTGAEDRERRGAAR
jgi:hypothetical protein